MPPPDPLAAALLALAEDETVPPDVRTWLLALASDRAEGAGSQPPRAPQQPPAA